MTVRDIVKEARNAVPAENLRRAMEAKGLTPNQLALGAFGRDARGKPRGSGNVYSALKGRYLFGSSMRPKLAAYLGIPESDLMIEGHKDRAPRNSRTERYTSAPVQQNPMNIVTLPPVGRPPNRPPPQFSLTVGQAGEAVVTLNMVMALDKAMRVMGALTAAGLLQADTKEDVAPSYEPNQR